MATQYIAMFVGAAVTGSSGPMAIHVSNAQAGDKVLNVIVALPGGPYAPGIDVTVDFASTVNTIPSLGNVNFMGPYLTQTGVIDLSTSTLLALMSRG